MRCVLVVAALLLAGCGSSSGGGGGSKSPKQTFAGTCGSCHTLKAAGTNGTFGPNLDQLAPDEARVVAAIKNGPGPMPNGLLKGKDADAVATYVSENTGQ